MSGTLIVPLDGSQLSEEAVPWAACLARTRGLSLLLVRVTPWVNYPLGDGPGMYLSPSFYDDILAASHEAAQAELDAQRQRLAEQGLTVETAVRDGPTADAILDLADEIGALAIVMATHGRGGLRRLLLGSVAERIIQQATRPVLLVPAGGSQAAPEKLRRVLVPLDGSSLAERAIQTAREVMADDGNLSLVQVVKPVERIRGVGELEEVVEDEAATHRAVEDATAYLEGLRRRLDQPGGTLQSEVREGRPADTIRDAARALGAELIVMATHGYTGPTRWRLGSVADEVVRQTERPVLLVSVRALAAQAAGPFTVRDLMTRELAVVREDETPITALRKLLRRRIRGAPVVDEDGNLVGVISEYDLLRWQARVVAELSHQDAPDPADYTRLLATGRVDQLMTRPAVTVDEAAPLAAALRLLLERRFGRLPVVRDGRLIGILSRADVLKAMAEQWAVATTD